MPWRDEHLLGYVPMDDTHKEFVALLDALIGCAQLRNRLRKIHPCTCPSAINFTINPVPTNNASALTNAAST